MTRSAEAIDKKTNKVAQAGVIPVRRMDDGRIEFCLVTSRSTGDWIFPKGKVDSGEDAPQAAVRETKEEAGLVGFLPDYEPLGTYVYQKNGKPHEVVVYSFLIEQVLESWEESDQRWRVFTDAQTAAQMVPFPELHDLIHWTEERLSLN
ncbi:MAG: NUDIX hydrolase [Pirellulales bacterium]|nr:NUDIX hydrolase [Pirellulales bacterium]